MLSVLLGLHFVLTLAIIGLILLQKHDSDGALGSSGGGAASGMFSVRGQANILTKSTGILMTIFMINCLIMAKITKNTPVKESVIDRVARESVIPKEKPAAPVKPASDVPAKSGHPVTSQIPNVPAKPANPVTPVKPTAPAAPVTPSKTK